MAHPQPKRRVQLSNDAKHLHAFHFEGHESYHLEGDASFDTVHRVRRARAAHQDDHAATAGVGPPPAAAAP